ncbi:MAG: hypothetical protein ABIQ59_13720 [Nocardioidaceae bacterium]
MRCPSRPWPCWPGSVAHLTAGGLLPGPVGMAALLAVVTTAAAPLLHTPASTLPPRVVPLDTTRLPGTTVFTVVLGRRGPPAPRAS